MPAPAPALPGERARTPSPMELSAFDVDAIDTLRAQQNEALDKAGMDAIETLSIQEAFVHGWEKRDEARVARAQEFDTEIDGYVTGHEVDVPEVSNRTRLADMLKRVSAHRMNNEKWQHGDKDADGNFIPGTSGRELVVQTLADIRGETPDDTPDDTELQDTPEMQELRIKVEEARKKAAALSVELRSKIRKRGRKNNALREQYDTADKKYHELFTELNLAEVRHLKAAGRTDEQVLNQGITSLLNEHQAFSLVEKDIITHDDSRKGKFVRWFAAKKWRLPLISGAVGIGVGYGFGIAKNVITPFVALPSAVLLPAVAGATVAVKSTRAILAATIGNRVDQLVHFDKRYSEDKAKLEGAAQGFTTGASDEATAKQHSNALRKLLSDRIEKDRKSNGRRVAIAAGAGALGGAIGYGIHEAVDTQGFGLWAHDTVGDNPPPPPPPPPYVDPNAGGGAPRIETVAVVDPNVVDGYDTNVVVENGHGYQREIIELLQEKNQHLSSDDSWKLYLHLQDKFPNGNFFTDNASYKMDDGYFGISRPGGSHWNPAVIHEINRWMAEHANEVTATRTEIVTS